MASETVLIKSGRPRTAPNYYLLLLGLGLAAILLGVYLSSHTILPPPLQALLIAGAMVLILYGIYPVPAIEGTFGKLYIAGPAALGLFIFLFVWKSLAVSSDRQFLVLQKLSDSKLNSGRLPGGATIILRDVDSLSDDKLTKILDAIRKAIDPSGTGNKEEVDRTLADFYKRIIRFLGFGVKEADALKLWTLYQSGGDGVDEKWTELIKEVSKQPGNTDYVKKLKRDPFAIVQILERGTNRLDLVLPGGLIVAGGKTYQVPIIANPAMSVTRGIQEGIVIQLED